MGRRSFASTNSSRPRLWYEDDNREWGFMTVSNEIDRALLSTSSRASTYLQEAIQVSVPTQTRNLVGLIYSILTVFNFSVAHSDTVLRSSGRTPKQSGQIR